MASSNKKTNADLYTQGKIGTYQMATGGGTPLKKGEKLADHPEAKRVMQPRDEDGQFTYNSANAIPLKDGPSRGKTIPPFLRGVTLTYCTKSSKTVTFGGKVYLNNLNMTASELIDRFKEYKEKGGFGKQLSQTAQAKRGARSKEEKQAISAGTQGAVAKSGTETGTVKGKSKHDFMNNFSQYKTRVANRKAAFAKKTAQAQPTQTQTQQVKPQAQPTQTAQPKAQPTQATQTQSSSGLHTVGSQTQQTGSTSKTNLADLLKQKKAQSTQGKQDSSKIVRKTSDINLSDDDVDDLLK